MFLCLFWESLPAFLFHNGFSVIVLWTKECHLLLYKEITHNKLEYHLFIFRTELCFILHWETVQIHLYMLMEMMYVYFAKFCDVNKKCYQLFSFSIIFHMIQDKANYMFNYLGLINWYSNSIFTAVLIDCNLWWFNFSIKPILFHIIQSSMNPFVYSEPRC